MKTLSLLRPAPLADDPHMAVGRSRDAVEVGRRGELDLLVLPLADEYHAMWPPSPTNTVEVDVPQMPFSA